MRFIVLILSCLLSADLRAAVSFDATNDRITAPYNASLNGPIALTISAWIRVAGNHQTSGANKYGTILGRLGLAPTRGWNFIHATEYVSWGTNILSFSVVYSTTSLQSSSTQFAVPTNQWMHVAVTYDGTTNSTGITYYTNGVATGIFASTYPNGSLLSQTNIACTIGSATNTTVTFNGQIDEVALWTNALTAAEILQLSSRIKRMPLHVRPSALVGYWPLDGNPDGAALTAAGSIIDMSQTANHATPNNSPTAKGESILSYP